MIVTTIEKLTENNGVCEDLEHAVSFAETLAEKPAGRYEYSKDIFAFVQEGTTKPIHEGRFEAHRKYVDIQMILEGEEEVVWQRLDKLTLLGVFDEDGDVGFYAGEGERTTMRAGDAYIAFPEDGHMPCVHDHVPHCYKKIVVKVPIRSGMNKK